MDNDFGVGELIHDGEFYDNENPFLSDLPFYKKYCSEATTRVLELCCGTGRLTIPLFEVGIDIIGLDIEKSMLDRAKEKAQVKGLDINFIQEDMRNFSFDEKFSLIFIPFNSIQNIYKLEDIENIFKCVLNNLTSDGRFILDIFNPSIELMANRKDKITDVSKYTLKDGRNVITTEKMKYDVVSQVNRVEWTLNIDGTNHIQKLDMRCFYPEEINALLKYNGFKLLKKFGDYDESDFTSKSMKQLCICERL